MHVEKTLSAATSAVESLLVKQPIAKAMTGMFGFLFVSYRAELMLICVVFLVDLITGVAAAIRAGEFQSAKFFKGCTKLIVYAVFILLAVGTDFTVSHHILGMDVSTRIFLSVTFSFIILTDVFSVFENLEKLGYSTPRKTFRKMVLNLKK